MKKTKITSTAYTANAFTTTAKIQKTNARRTYPYSYEAWDNNYGARRELLSDRIRFWLNKHEVGGRPMPVTLFAQYVNSFSRRTGITFSYSCLYGYLRDKYSPKSDRTHMLAMAMGVSVAWLEGYGPRTSDFAADMGTLNAIVAKTKAGKQARARKTVEAKIRKRKAA